MNIFYSKKTLKNNIVGCVLDEDNVISKKTTNGIEYWKDNKIVGFNLSNNDNDISLKEGRLYLNSKLMDYLNTKLSSKIEIQGKGFVVGKVLECDKIPDTHLSKCKVDIKDEVLDIVCGAKNVKKDLLVVVATIGTLMPSGMIIKPSKLKSFNSNGMLCSQSELLLNGFNDSGIIELSSKYKVGDVFKEMYKNL